MSFTPRCVTGLPPAPSALPHIHRVCLRSCGVLERWIELKGLWGWLGTFTFLERCLFFSAGCFCSRDWNSLTETLPDSSCPNMKLQLFMRNALTNLNNSYAVHTNTHCSSRFFRAGLVINVSSGGVKYRPACLSLPVSAHFLLCEQEKHYEWW